MKKRICVILTTRGNYGKLKSTMSAIQSHDNLELQLVVGGALLLNRYGEFEELIQKDGFTISARLPYIIDGETLEATSKSAAKCTALVTDVFSEFNPDIVLIIADRFEMLAISLAAICMNIRMAHIEGGEASGSIDDRIRHAITKLANLHFPANQNAADRIISMGEEKKNVYVVGATSLDQIKGFDLSDAAPLEKYLSVNGKGKIDIRDNFLLVSYHPVVTEYAEAANQLNEIITAIKRINMPVLWIYPNLDAGASEISCLIQSLHEDDDMPPVCSLGSLPLNLYAVAMAQSGCLVGNSSSGLREGAYLGTPVVNIGSRQQKRLRAANVIDVSSNADAIYDAIRVQLEHGAYDASHLYGDGCSGHKIVQVLASTEIKLVKAF